MEASGRRGRSAPRAGHVRSGRRLEEGRAATTTLSSRGETQASQARGRGNDAATAAPTRRPLLSCRRAAGEAVPAAGRAAREREVEVQFSAGRLGSAAAVSVAAAAAALAYGGRGGRLEREHFWKIINAFRYYG